LSSRNRVDMPRILVADDDTVMLSLLTTLMQIEGNEITTVTRPAEIIAAVERERPDLILADYYLADGDVMETLVELKSSDGLQTIPVLVTSGMDHEVACLNAGADGFILKPFRPAELLERMKQLLDMQSILDHA
jgi:DNA-binding response OmpR family regulator